jgi:hypothetical protein
MQITYKEKDVGAPAPVSNVKETERERELLAHELTFTNIYQQK